MSKPVDGYHCECGSRFRTRHLLYRHQLECRSVSWRFIRPGKHLIRMWGGGVKLEPGDVLRREERRLP